MISSSWHQHIISRLLFKIFIQNQSEKQEKIFPLKDKVKAEPGRTLGPPIIVSKFKQKLTQETFQTRIGREKFKENHEVKMSLHVV